MEENKSVFACLEGFDQTSLISAEVLLYLILLFIILILMRNKRLLIEKNTALDLVQEQLKKSEQRLQTIIDTEPECVKVVNQRGQLIEMNYAGLSMLEAATLKEAQECSLVDYILPEGRTSFIELHKKVMNGESGILEFEIKGLKGTHRWLETHATPLRDEKGDVVALLGITRNITEKKNAEMQLQENVQFYHSIFSSVDEAVFILEDNLVIDCNERALILLKMSKEDIIGSDIQTSTRKFECSGHSFNEYLTQAREGTTPIVRCSLVLSGLVNENKIIEVTINTLSTGQKNRLLLSIRDMTQHLEQESRMLANMRQAQMGEMISNIAHQWRQPLSIINSIASLIQLHEHRKKEPDASLIEKSIDIEKQIQYLSQTIADFRDFFNIDKSKEYVIISKVIENALNLFDHAIKSHRIITESVIRQDSEVLLVQNEVLQVIVVLLKNSLDAFVENEIESGQIMIIIDRLDAHAIITIQDNAGGIHPNIINNIFLPYFTTKTQSIGTGIGLSLSKTIIEDHCRGSIEVESENECTTFTIKLPLEES